MFKAQQGLDDTPAPETGNEKNGEEVMVGTVLGKRGTVEKNKDSQEGTVSSEGELEKSKKMKGENTVRGGESKGIEDGAEAIGLGAADELTGATTSARQEG